MPFAALALGVVLFEEWIWRSAASSMARLGRWPRIAQAERRLRGAPVWVAVLAFLVPGALLFPAKLLGLWLIATDQALLGASVFVAAKLIGAAAVARVYAITEPSLRSVGWINASLDFIFGLKNKLANHLGESAWGRWAAAAARRLRSRLSHAKAGWASKRMAFALRREKRRGCASPTDSASGE